MERERYTNACDEDSKTKKSIVSNIKPRAHREVSGRTVSYVSSHLHTLNRSSGVSESSKKNTSSSLSSASSLLSSSTLVFDSDMLPVYNSSILARARPPPSFVAQPRYVYLFLLCHFLRVVQTVSIYNTSVARTREPLRSRRMSASSSGSVQSIQSSRVETPTRAKSLLPLVV